MLRQLIIEATNACNSACVFCPHKLSTRPIVHIDLGLYEKVIKEVKQYGINTGNVPVGICGIGEPFLHPHFVDLLEIAKKHNVPLGVGSNGGLLWKYVDALIEYAPTQVVFSIDAVTPETHAKMRPGVGFERTVSALETYMTKLYFAKKRPQEMWIQILVSDFNKHEVQPFIDKWMPYVAGIPGAKLFIKCVCPWPYHEANTMYPSPDPGLTPGQILDEKIDIAGFETPPVYQKGCTLFESFAQVMSDGTYIPCCMAVHDPWGVGNVKDFTLKDLYNSSKMRGMRKMAKEDLPFCKDCI